MQSILFAKRWARMTEILFKKLVFWEAVGILY